MAFKKLVIALILFIIALLFFFLAAVLAQEKSEEGQLSIFFMGEKVGYEEFILKSNELGFILEVTGRMTKPVALETRRLILQLDRSYIPRSFYFEGSISGVSQEISSSITEGNVENTIKVSGQVSRTKTKIKRDAFLLPNAIFSPYVFLAKKFRCHLQELTELSAYVIPQLEVSFTLEPKEDSPCFFIINMGGIEIELETDERGYLKSLRVPSQRLKVIQRN